VFNLGIPELVCLLLIVVIAFGSTKIPDLSTLSRRSSAPITMRWAWSDWLLVCAAVLTGAVALALLSAARW
jgi:hypothetical protein